MIAYGTGLKAKVSYEVGDNNLQNVYPDFISLAMKCTVKLT
jgi:hypothetical protein